MYKQICCNCITTEGVPCVIVCFAAFKKSLCWHLIFFSRLVFLLQVYRNITKGVPKKQRTIENNLLLEFHNIGGISSFKLNPRVHKLLTSVSIIHNEVSLC